MKKHLSLLVAALCALKLGAFKSDTTAIVAVDSIALDNVIVYGCHNSFGPASSQMSAVTLSKE